MKSKSEKLSNILAHVELEFNRTGLSNFQGPVVQSTIKLTCDKRELQKTIPFYSINKDFFKMLFSFAVLTQIFLYLELKISFETCFQQTR